MHPPISDETSGFAKYKHIIAASDLEMKQVVAIFVDCHDSNTSNVDDIAILTWAVKPLDSSAKLEVAIFPSCFETTGLIGEIGVCNCSP